MTQYIYLNLNAYLEYKLGSFQFASATLQLVIRNVEL